MSNIFTLSEFEVSQFDLSQWEIYVWLEWEWDQVLLQSKHIYNNVYIIVI